MKISEILKTSAGILQASGIVAPRREAYSLLAYALNKNHTFLVAHDDYELSVDEETRFQKILERRAGREPLQYITGRQEFYGLNFAVSPSVLIPRPETELLVEAAIEILRENSRFCEIGIGSGCISISILHAVKNAAAVGLDVSEKALEVARQNAETHAVAERLRLKKSDVFESLCDEQFDLIVSNPPYISAAEMPFLQSEVRDYEPAKALTDGADGFSIIKKIIADAPRFLEKNGFLLLEIGFNQSARVRAMFDESVWRQIATLPDLQGIPRVFKAQKI